MLLLVILLLPVWAACAGEAAESPEKDLSRFAGIKIGVITGSQNGPQAEAAIPDVKIYYYNTLADALVAMRAGKVDAVCNDESLYKFLIKENDDLEKLAVVDEVSLGAVFPKTEEGKALCEQYSAFVEKLWADGTIAEIDDIWFGTDEKKRTLPDLSELPAVNGTLSLAVDPGLPPFTYMKDGRIVGYDVDIIIRFCRECGYGLQIAQMNFDGLLASVQSSKYDMAACGITITEERAEALYFSSPNYRCDTILFTVKRTEGETPAGIISFGDLNGKRFGVQTGTTFDEITLSAFPDAKISYFNSYSDMAKALEAHKIDAFPGDEPVLRLMAAENPKLAVLEEALDSFEFGIVLPKTDEGRKLRDEMNEWLAGARESGKLDQLLTEWINGPEDAKSVPDLTLLPAPKGTLRMITEGAYAPMNYYGESGLVGLEIDLAAHFCEACGYGLKVSAVSFDAILPAVQTGKADFAIAGISITDERKESVLFTDPYYTGGTMIAVLKEDAAPENNSLWEGIKSSFEKTFIREDRWKLFTEGIYNTLILTVLSALCGTALGFGVFLLCRNGNKIANGITRFLMWLVQGMPVVVLLMILYYVVFGKSTITGKAVSVVGFTLTFGASVFFLLKMGVGAVDKGQYEAAYALGYTNLRAFFKIILPQGLPHILPAYKGEIVSLIKATSVVGYIAVQDLTKMGDIVRSRTYEAFFPLIAVTVIYFVLEALPGLLVSRIDISVDPRRRKAEKILKGVNTDDQD